jgi:hypothetical protein
MKNFKQYITEVFSNTQIDVLKKEYESLSKIDPTSSSYKKLIKLLDSLPQDKLNQLANSNIKFISPLAKNRLIKVGDKIRTIKGGQIPGIVTKIEGTKVHFNHATDVYDTHFSGAKGKPKEYVVHISNIQKENKQTESSTHKSFDFDILDGPRTKRKVGGSSSVKGDTPEDALKQKHARDGYQKLDVIKKDGLLIVKGYLSTSQVDYYYYRLSKVNV